MAGHDASSKAGTGRRNGLKVAAAALVCAVAAVVVLGVSLVSSGGSGASGDIASSAQEPSASQASGSLAVSGSSPVQGSSSVSRAAASDSSGASPGAAVSSGSAAVAAGQGAVPDAPGADVDAGNGGVAAGYGAGAQAIAPDGGQPATQGDGPQLEQAQPEADTPYTPPVDGEGVVLGSVLPDESDVQPIEDEHEPDSVLVEVNPGMSPEDISTYLQALDYVETKQITEDDIMFGFIALDLAEGVTVEQAMAALEETEFALYAQPDYIMHVSEDWQSASTDDAQDGAAGELAAAEADEPAGPDTLGEGFDSAPDAVVGDEPSEETAAESDGVEVVGEEELDAVDDEVLVAQAPGDTIVTNDPKSVNAWELDAIHAREAWSLVQSNHTVTVAILDSGCDVNHADLAANIVDTWSVLNGSTDVADTYGHGTSVAGIVAAQADNGVGMAGVSYNAGIIPVQVMDSAGNVTTANALKAVEYVVDLAHGHPEYNIRVLNLSFCGKLDSVSDDPQNASRALVNAIDAASDGGLLVVCAAGNSRAGWPLPYRVYPADYVHDALTVINVAPQSSLQKTAANLRLSTSSNYNFSGEDKKNVSAPGTNVNITRPNSQYSTGTGTSYAAPMVSGVAALAFAANPDLTAYQVRQIILDTAVDVVSDESGYGVGFDDKTGYGVVDAYATVKTAQARLIGEGEIEVGGSTRFKLPDAVSGDWEFSSSDPSIASVDQFGNVTGIDAGTAVISARGEGAVVGEYKTTVTVYQVPGLINATVNVGSSTEMVFVPAPATGSWRWKSSDAGVASVDSAGKVTGVAPGTATITVSLASNPAISRQATVTVNAVPLAASNVSTIPAQTYTGSALEPPVVVTVDNKTLIRNTDFMVSYADNVNAGTATYTVTGKGNYTGTVSRTFLVNQRTITSGGVSNAVSQTYTGAAICPAVTVTYGGKSLRQNTDYTLEYSDNVAVGTAKYTVRGMGNFRGTVTKTFAINKRTISASGVSAVATQTYTGKAITPPVTVTFGNIALQAGVDYSIAYSGNVNPGTATYTVTGKGNYAGTVSKTFAITKDAAAWSRLAGPIALDTMSAIVDEGSFEQNGTVVLVTIGGYWDALTAAGVAGLAGAPVLMTDGKALSAQTAAQLASLKPRTVIVCGGTAAVSDSVMAAAIRAAGNSTRGVRLAGSNAILTAEDIYKRGAGYAPSGSAWSNTAFVCTSNGYWDALSAAPVSYAKRMPIFLTDTKGVLNASTLKTMKDGGITQAYIVGGTAAIPASTQQQLESNGISVKGRLAGARAIETSESVANFGLTLGMAADKMGVATSNGYWDALAGAALCGRRNSVLVLVDGPNAASIAGFVKSHANVIKSGYVFGGTAAVSESTYRALQAATPKK